MWFVNYKRHIMRKSFGVVLGLSLFAASAANAVMIDFESEATGTKVNGYTIGDVSFSDTSGADLQVDDWANQSDGQALGVFNDDSSRLQMDFASDVDYLAFDLGNDDPGWESQGDGNLYAEIWNNGSFLTTLSFAPNWNDDMDQRFEVTGYIFDMIQIYHSADLIEIVDNIEYNVSAVPLPAAVWLLGSGLIGLAGMSRRKGNAVAASA